MGKKIKATTVMKEEAKPEETEKSESKLKAPVPRRAMWKGSLTIGLINVPISLYPMIYDRGIQFHFLHKTDGQPLRYERVCTKDGRIVPWDEVIKGYEVAKKEFIVFDKNELDAMKPESDRRIRIDKFIDYLSIDPIYFNTSYILMPDKSDDAYSLLLTALEKKGKACVGRITLRTKEYPAIVHAYRHSLVLTTLRYGYDVADPQKFEEVQKLKEPEKAELDLAVKIISDLSGEFNIAEYKDQYREKVEALIQKKLKGEKIVVEKPVKEEAKELMAALRETLQQLEKK